MSMEKEEQDKYAVEGKLVFEESGHPAAGLRVVLMDADLIFDDKLGEAMSSEEGKFRITYDKAQFKDLFERAPDLYVLVYDKDDHLLASSKETIFYDAKPMEEITVKIPGSEDQPVTRTKFTKLLLGNPNYFGNMPDLGFDPVEIQIGNTGYEELVCLGLHPQAERLEAVVHIKRPFGYMSGPCDDGSTEYVRFFVEDGGGWRDLGVASFTSYNMPGSDLPLSYSLSVSLDEVIYE